jgi:hypothetical protein
VFTVSDLVSEMFGELLQEIMAEARNAARISLLDFVYIINENKDYELWIMDYELTMVFSIVERSPYSIILDAIINVVWRSNQKLPIVGFLLTASTHS